MKLLSFIWYDIKRLFGHGKTAVLAVLAPIPVVLMFGLFLAPVLADGKGAFINGALCNDDDSLMLTMMMDMVVDYEVKKGNAVITSVPDVETGRSMIEDGRAAVLLHVPEGTYQKAMNGEKAVMKFYYAPSHAFDALTFQSGIESSISVFGQGIRVINVAGDTAGENGMSEAEFTRFRNDAVTDLIGVYLHRGEIIGKKGVFLLGGDYHLRYALAILFAACAFFASFPVMYLTCLDKSGVLAKRSVPAGKMARWFFARIISGTILILCTFAVMYPMARALRQVKLSSALAVLPGMILTALTFSALAVLIGSLFRNGQSALWIGLYFGAASFVGVTFLSDKAGLPGIVSLLMRISPFRASVSIFSNAMFNLMIERYAQDMLVLLAAFVLFTAAGFFAYRKRGVPYE
ncbi:MAG: ABC transporter permease [Lachnospiraceae bacterium]|nr:ABC transporter permease [Lachnospiraceae bacterium]